MKSPAFSAAMPTYIASTGSATSVAADARDVPPDRRPRRLRMREREDREQPWVIVGNADALGRIDEVLPRPFAGSRPPAPMRDRHERAQRHVRGPPRRASAAAIATNVFAAPGLEPDVSAEHLPKPCQAGCLERTESGRLWPAREQGGARRRPGRARRRPRQRAPAVPPFVCGSTVSAAARSSAAAATVDRAASPRRCGVLIEGRGDSLVGAQRPPSPDATAGAPGLRPPRPAPHTSAGPVLGSRPAAPQSGSAGDESAPHPDDFHQPYVDGGVEGSSSRPGGP